MVSLASKKSSGSPESMVIDPYAIRLMIGVIAFCLPWAVSIKAFQIPDSISWSYHTNARDVFVGALFVIGAFLICYKGHFPTATELEKMSRFWRCLGRLFGRYADNISKWGRENEEDIVGWTGGIAAWVTTLCPTSYCIEHTTNKVCPFDPISIIHYIGAIILFSTTVYFCLIAFRRRVEEKISSGSDPIYGKKRLTCYQWCGRGFAVIMLSLFILKFAHFGLTINNLTFAVETTALALFGFAWLVASQYIPGFVTESMRKKTGLEILIKKLLKPREGL